MAFEHEFDALEKQARDQGLNQPLQKITDMLERWSREPIHTQDEVIKFATELWVSLADYEKDMKESVKGHQIIISIKEHKYMSHIEWIKNKLGFYAELYEVTTFYLFINIILLASFHRAETETSERKRKDNDVSL